MKITLDAVEFDSEAITPSKLADTFDKINDFLNRTVGCMMASGEANAADQKVALVLNAGNQLKAAGEQWRGTSNIAQPAMRPVPVPPAR
jgi:hypothetical protein